jgi:hypothetical protein
MLPTYKRPLEALVTPTLRIALLMLAIFEWDLGAVKPAPGQTTIVATAMIPTKCLGEMINMGRVPFSRVYATFSQRPS